jgi:DNA-binding winged helix-turn-helix (wHTH) protein
MEPTHFESLYPPRTRFEEISHVIEILRAGRSAQVIGLPGVGKSNVLRLLPYNKEVRILHLGKEDENRWHFVYMDFSEIRGRSSSDVIKFILISLSYSLGERQLTEEQTVVNGLLKEALEFSDDLILFQGLKKSLDYLASERNLYLVFLFDRFEDYIPSIDDKFFLNLKILRNRIKYNFLSVFAVTRPIEDVLDISLLGEFHEFIVGNAVFLPVKDSVGLKFRFEYLEKITGKNAPKATKEEIENLTGGHGKLARLCYEAVLSNDKAKSLEELFMSKAPVKRALAEIWNYLLPEEQADIRLQESNEFLVKIDLTNDDGNTTVPLLKSFINASATTNNQRDLRYDEARNEIKKGDEILSDKLTPSEFRLLRFLLQNRGTICEKDEIIINVWKDSKTQEGVTDQALDQIIYRLRKKIEDDPNNPHFIHTVKGRGYKLEN